MAIKAADAPLVGGAPAWLSNSIWSYAPIFLISVYLLIALYRFRKPMTSRVRTPVSDATNDTTRENERRQLVSDGRSLIARFNRQTRHDHLIDFLADKAVWHTIRARIDPKVLADIENGRLSVVTKGDTKDGKVYYLGSELDRLEREWGLL
jgi:hypothetical protein